MVSRSSDQRERVRSGIRRMLTGLRAALGIDLFSFRDKVVLVTGGSRGLGLAMARRLAREGAKLVLIARDEEELARAKEDLQRRGAEALTIKCDVRERGQVQAAVRQITTELGAVDVLINNAGVIQVGPLELMTLDDFEDSIKTHIMGPLHTSLAVLPEMRRRGAGRIINIASLGGKVPMAHLAPYGAGKFGLVGLSEGMRAELLKDGIVVTTVTPGLLRTGSIYNATFKGRNREEFAWFAILDSLPLVSMSANRAARLILRGSRFGRAEVAPTILAKIALRIHGLLPGISTDNVGFLGRLLPQANGVGTRGVKGRDSQSRLTTSILTILNQIAARDLNQLGSIQGSGSPEGKAGRAGRAGVPQPGQSGQSPGTGPDREG